jgi:hypothetical protein
MSNTQLQTLNLDQLSLVAGGAGPFEDAGRAAGTAGGQVLANATPPPVRPVAQAVLPPVGGQVGAWAGRQVDNVVSRLPRLW